MTDTAEKPVCKTCEGRRVFRSVIEVGTLPPQGTGDIPRTVFAPFHRIFNCPACGGTGKEKE